MIEIARYMAYDEGCYECGEPSGVLGFFDTQEAAQAEADAASERQEADWRGQHSMFVIDLLDPTYSAYSSRQPAPLGD